MEALAEPEKEEDWSHVTTGLAPSRQPAGARGATRVRPLARNSLTAQTKPILPAEPQLGV